MPVKPRPQLAPVVRLNHQDSEGQTTNDLVGEANCRALVARVVDFQYSDASAVVDGGELVEALSGPRDDARGTSRPSADGDLAAASRTASSVWRGAGASGWRVAS